VIPRTSDERQAIQQIFCLARLDRSIRIDLDHRQKNIAKKT